MPIDPCFEALLADRRLHLRPPAPPVSLQDLREGANRFMRQARGPELTSVAPIVFEATDGRRIPGRAYRPSADPRPAVVFVHGGGFVLGDLDTHDAICRHLAAASGCAVLAVGYRLAPENAYPAAVLDCVDALAGVARAPESFGVHAGAVGIAADSAGAHVALCAALACRGIPLAHAALLYPVVDPRCESGSMRELASGYMLTRDALRWFWDCYVPHAGARAVPPVDLLGAELGSLPPTTIVTAEFDPLRDEGAALARRLAAAGVQVDHACEPGMIHGFAGMPQFTPAARRVLEGLGATLGRALGVRRRPVAGSANG